jgi:mono/diheme cytochrome c family protein
MWNHAPTMWSAMKQAGVERKGLNEQQAADLFAFFYSSRFFDKPGDAAQGKQAFTSRHCSECHNITGSNGIAPPVAEWKSLGRPIDLAEEMWNHASQMRAEFARHKIEWQQLTSQNLTDILVYLRNLPVTRKIPMTFETTSGDKGQALFASKGCINCHVGKLELPPRLAGMTMTDIAVAMWNHAPKMEKAQIHMEPGEMNQIVSYLWAQRFFGSTGRADRGKKVFAEKSCGSCHGDASSGAPPVSALKDLTSISMVSALWQHGPTMAELMSQRKIAWPRFTGSQMSDLIAYLNTAP